MDEYNNENLYFLSTQPEKQMYKDSGFIYDRYGLINTLQFIHIQVIFCAIIDLHE